MPDFSLGISDFGIPTAFLWIAFIVELTPGPNMAYLAALTLAEGRRAGFVTVAGIAMGLLLVSLLAAFGVATFVSEIDGPLCGAEMGWRVLHALARLRYLAGKRSG